LLTAAPDNSLRPVSLVNASSISRRQAPRVKFDRLPPEFARAPRKHSPYGQETATAYREFRAPSTRPPLRGLFLAGPIAVDQIAASVCCPKVSVRQARSSSRVRFGADNLCVGMLPDGPAGASRKPDLMLYFRQGAYQLFFPATLRIHRPQRLF
jgi:hypothetical protein